MRSRVSCNFAMLVAFLVIFWGFGPPFLRPSSFSSPCLGAPYSCLQEDLNGEERGAKPTRGIAGYRIKSDARQLLDNIVIPAANSNSQSEYFEAFQLLLTGSSINQLEEIERYCSDQARFSFKQKYVDVLLMRVQEGQLFGTIALPYEHAFYVADGLRDRMEREMAEIREFAFFDEHFQLPENWREAELLFWDAHVNNNRLHNVKAIANVALQTVRPHVEKYQKNDRQNRLPSLLPFLDLPDQVVNEYFKFKGNDAAFHVQQEKFAA